MLDQPDARAEAAVREAAARNPSCRPSVVQVHARVLRKGADAVDARPLFDDAALTPEQAFGFAWQSQYGPESTPTDPVLQRFRELVARVDGGAR
jgi:hypothetical protein